jgi:hypothetical protein
MRFAVAVAAASLVAGTQMLSAQAREAAEGPTERVVAYDATLLQPPHLLNEYQVPGLMRFYYPPAFLKNPVNDQVILSFTVDTLGAADLSTIQVIKGEHPELIAATKSVVAKLKFTPGVVRSETPRRVPVTVTLPLVWAAK